MAGIILLFSATDDISSSLFMQLWAKKEKKNSCASEEGIQISFIWYFFKLLLDSFFLLFS